MHQPIKAILEEYLSGMVDPVKRERMEDHLGSCELCRRMLDAMRRQSGLFRVLRPAGDPEPAPGFYARVLDRIESKRIPSVWEILLEPVFGRRLAYVSLTLLIVLGTFMVAGGGLTGDVAPYSYNSPEVIFAEGSVSPDIQGDVESDRNVVLVNLATYQD